MAFLSAEIPYLQLLDLYERLQVNPEGATPSNGIPVEEMRSIIHEALPAFASLVADDKINEKQYVPVLLSPKETWQLCPCHTNQPWPPCSLFPCPSSLLHTDKDVRVSFADDLQPFMADYSFLRNAIMLYVIRRAQAHDIVRATQVSLLNGGVVKHWRWSSPSSPFFRPPLPQIVYPKIVCAGHSRVRGGHVPAQAIHEPVDASIDRTSLVRWFS